MLHMVKAGLCPTPFRSPAPQIGVLYVLLPTLELALLTRIRAPLAPACFCLCLLSAEIEGVPPTPTPPQSHLDPNP